MNGVIAETDVAAQLAERRHHSGYGQSKVFDLGERLPAATWGSMASKAEVFAWREGRSRRSTLVPGYSSNPEL